jgi:hypothetical protein
MWIAHLDWQRLLVAGNNLLLLIEMEAVFALLVKFSLLVLCIHFFINFFFHFILRCLLLRVYFCHLFGCAVLLNLAVQIIDVRLLVF